MSARSDLAGHCGSCRAGDHQQHQPQFGGICIGCACEVRPELAAPAQCCGQCDAADAVANERSRIAATLLDPEAVRANLLRGTIATPQGLVWLTDTDGPVSRLVGAERARLKALVEKWSETLDLTARDRVELAALFEVQS